MHTNSNKSVSLFVIYHFTNEHLVFHPLVKNPKLGHFRPCFAGKTHQLSAFLLYLCSAFPQDKRFLKRGAPELRMIFKGDYTSVPHQSQRIALLIHHSHINIISQPIQRGLLDLGSFPTTKVH